MRQLIQSTSRVFVFFLTDILDHFTPKMGLVDGDFTYIEMSKDGGAFVDISGDVTVTEIDYGFYKFTLTTTHTNTVGDLAFYISATGADEAQFLAQVVAVGAGTDPWDVTLPGSYGSGKAGKIVGDNLDAKVGDVKAKTDLLPGAFPTEVADETTSQDLLKRIKKIEKNTVV